MFNTLFKPASVDMENMGYCDGSHVGPVSVKAAQLVRRVVSLSVETASFKVIWVDTVV